MLKRTSNFKAVVKPNKPQRIATKNIMAILVNLEQVKLQQAAIRRYYHAKLRG